jgi:hypothetical protein
VALGKLNPRCVPQARKVKTLVMLAHLISLTKKITQVFLSKLLC